jgi:hypothetical protein
VDLRDECPLDAADAVVEGVLEIHVVSLVLVGSARSEGLRVIERLEAARHFLIVVGLVLVHGVLNLTQPTCHLLVFLVKKVLLRGFTQVLNQRHVLGIEQLSGSILIYLFSDWEEGAHEVTLVDEGHKHLLFCLRQLVLLK